MSESTEMEGTVKKRRAEGQAETSYPKSCINRSVDNKMFFQGVCKYFSCAIDCPHTSLLCSPLPHCSFSFSS